MDNNDNGTTFREALDKIGATPAQLILFTLLVIANFCVIVHLIQESF